MENQEEEDKDSRESLVPVSIENKRDSTMESMIGPDISKTLSGNPDIALPFVERTKEGTNKKDQKEQKVFEEKQVDEDLDTLTESVI